MLVTVACCAVSSGSHKVPIVDHMSFTAIWSQPVTALQIKDWDGQWRYVRHIENALVSYGKQFFLFLLISWCHVC